MEIVVFQEGGSGVLKLAGVRTHGKDLSISQVYSIDGPLPAFIEEPDEYIDDTFHADLVLNYLRHPDLVEHLIRICGKKQIPIVSPGKKGAGFTPFTCCGLGRNQRLGAYGEQFGLPEYQVTLDEERIVGIRVVRGAPCGASWEVLDDCLGCTVEEALTKLPRLVQYRCSADPSGFDPVSGKSPVHYAGYVHIAALKKAIEEAAGQESSGITKVEKGITGKAGEQESFLK